MIEYRYEFKYLVDLATARQIEACIQSYGMKLDEKAPGGSYVVTSLYFDNVHKTDYYDKSGGFIHRKKLRARIYAPEMSDAVSHVWFEVKERHDAMIRKERALLTREQWERLFKEGPRAFLASASPALRSELAPVIWEWVEENRRPEILVRYTRKPYLSDENGDRFRVTFDERIEACRSSDLWYPSGWVFIEPERVVLEIKFFREAPVWFGELIRRFELRRVSISKYGRGVEAVRSFQTMPR